MARQLRFLVVFVAGSVSLFLLSAPAVRPHMSLVGWMIGLALRLGGRPGEVAATAAGLEAATLTVTPGPGGAALGLSIDFPTLAPALLTGLLVATPGLGVGRLVASLGAGQAGLLLIRALYLLAFMAFDEHGLAHTAEIEPREALYILLMAAHRLAPALLWLLLAAPALPSLVAGRSPTAR